MNYNYDVIISDNLKKLIEQVNMALDIIITNV